MNWFAPRTAPGRHAVHPEELAPVEHHWYSLDGTPLLLREATRGDAPGLAQFWAAQSQPSRRMRFHGSVQMPTDPLHAAAGEAQVFVVQAHRAPAPRLVAHACLANSPHGEPGEAEFALSIDDQWQGRGLGRRVLRLLMQTAQARGHHLLCADVLKDNHAMRRLLAQPTLRCGLNDHGGPVLRAEIPLYARRPGAAWLRRAERASSIGWLT